MKTITGKVIDVPTQKVYLLVAQNKTYRASVGCGTPKLSANEVVNDAQYWDDSYDKFIVEIEVPAPEEGQP